MDGIVEKIDEFVRNFLTEWITANLETMFTDVNEKVGTVSTVVGTTPQAWNTSIYDLIKNLSDNVIIPIAGMSSVFENVPK